MGSSPVKKIIVSFIYSGTGRQSISVSCLSAPPAVWDTFKGVVGVWNGFSYIFPRQKRRIIALRMTETHALEPIKVFLKIINHLERPVQFNWTVPFFSVC